MATPASDPQATLSVSNASTRNRLKTKHQQNATVSAATLAAETDTIITTTVGDTLGTEPFIDGDTIGYSLFIDDVINSNT